jgi:hypothetical protein
MILTTSLGSGAHHGAGVRCLIGSGWGVVLEPSPRRRASTAFVRSPGRHGFTRKRSHPARAADALSQSKTRAVNTTTRMSRVCGFSLIRLVSVRPSSSPGSESSVTRISGRSSTASRYASVARAACSVQIPWRRSHSAYISRSSRESSTRRTRRELGALLTRRRCHASRAVRYWGEPLDSIGTVGPGPSAVNQREDQLIGCVHAS